VSAVPTPIASGSVATIDFFGRPTPNALKVATLLEELGLAYRLCPVNIRAGEQFAPSFLAISPNNKVPAIVDPSGPGGKPFAVFESGAILLYFAEKTGRLWPAEPVGRHDVLQWFMSQMGGVGPMLGQAHHFRAHAPERIPYAIDRYTREAARLFSVIDRRLAARAFLAGDYSVADVAVFSWMRLHELQGQDPADFPALKGWFTAVEARPSMHSAVTKLAGLQP